MSDLHKDVRFTWQLVSQFVSWEFCRYMSEQNELCTPETDILSFLRNMVVQRTEKTVSEITKHEIIAKFIMELKAVRNLQFSCVIQLSENVKRICPELELTVNKLIGNLETFFEVLEYTDEERKQLIELRIDNAINDFSKEASRLLPPPDLLQVVEAWNHHHSHIHARPVKKVTHNAMLFEKVLECIHYETITPPEAKIIAIALAQDKIFEKLLRNAEAEPETEADSMSQPSQPSEHVYSQEFAKNYQCEMRNEIPPNSHNPGNRIEKRTHFHADVHPEEVQPDSPDILNAEELENPPHLSPVAPYSPPCTVHPVIHRLSTEQNENVELPDEAYHNNRQCTPSSPNDSEELNSNLHDRLHIKFQEIYNNQRLNANQSDSDTSDCDKNAEIRFLTPTYYKKQPPNTKNPKSQVIYVSDNDSFDSSVITEIANSQENDPNWSSKQSLIAATEYMRVKKKMADPPKRTIPRKTSKKKSAACVLSSSDSDNNLANQPRITSHLISSKQKTVEMPAKKRKIAKPLYSPNISMDDFISHQRRPADILSFPSTSTFPVHKGIITRSARKKNPGPTSSPVKKHKCDHCGKAFVSLRSKNRHVFLKHSEGPNISDSDD